MKVVIIWLLLGVIVKCGFAICPVSVVSTDGVFQSRQMNLQIQESVGTSPCYVSSVGVPGCKMVEILNSLFGTEFSIPTTLNDPSKPKCLGTLCSSQYPQIVILSSNSPSAQPQPDQTMCLHGSSDLILFHIWASDVMRDDDVPSNKEALTSIFTQRYLHHQQQQEKNNVKLPFVILVHNNGRQSDESIEEMMKTRFMNQLEGIWSLVSGNSAVKMTEVLDVSWQVIQEGDHEDNVKEMSNNQGSEESEKGLEEGGKNRVKQSYKKLKHFIQPKLTSVIESKSLQTSSSSLDDNWQKTRDSVKHINTILDQNKVISSGSIFLLDVALRRSLKRCKSSLFKFRRDAEKGLLVPHFGKQVSEIVVSILSEYDRRTRPVLLQQAKQRFHVNGMSTLSESRSEKRSLVYSTLENEIKAIQTLLISNIKELNENKLNTMMLAQVKKLHDPRELLKENDVKNIVENIQLETNQQLSDLMVSCYTSSISQDDDDDKDEKNEQQVWLIGEKENELSKEIFAEKVNGFEQQPETQALRRDLFLRFSQKHSTMPKKPPGITPKLNMVAYLCAPGQGNFNGYTTIGFSPNVNLLVVAENSHRGEESGDFRKFINFQPKIHFDVSL